MTADDFRDWLTSAKSSGLIRSDADAARAFGIHVNTIVKYKQDGASRTVALACSALYHRIKPWGEK